MMTMIMMRIVSDSIVERHIFKWPRDLPKRGRDIFWKITQDQRQKLYPSFNIIREIKCKMDEIGDEFISHGPKIHRQSHPKGK
jgi:hypothetical protein